MSRRLLVFVALLFLALAGCGEKGDAPVAVAPVTGKVTYAGKPAAGVQVFLIPETAPMVPQIPANPHGVTGPDGAFKVTTFGADDGAAAGSYLVVLVWPPEPDPSNPEDATTDRLLGWYTAAHSHLRANVPVGGVALPAYDLPAKSTPPEVGQGVPGRN